MAISEQSEIKDVNQLGLVSERLILSRDSKVNKNMLALNLTNSDALEREYGGLEMDVNSLIEPNEVP